MKRASLKNELEVRDNLNSSDEPLPYSPAPSRRGKVMLNVAFERAARDQLRAVAAENQTTVQAIVRELVNDYFEKYGKKPIA